MRTRDGGSKSTRFNTVRFESGDGDGFAAGICSLEVAENAVILDDGRVTIGPGDVLEVCRDAHNGHRVKLVYRDADEHCTLYLDCGLHAGHGQVLGNRRLFTAIHNALLQRPADLYGA